MRWGWYDKVTCCIQPFIPTYVHTYMPACQLHAHLFFGVSSSGSPRTQTLQLRKMCRRNLHKGMCPVTFHPPPLLSLPPSKPPLLPLPHSLLFATLAYFLTPTPHRLETLPEVGPLVMGAAQERGGGGGVFITTVLVSDPESAERVCDIAKSACDMAKRALCHERHKNLAGLLVRVNATSADREMSLTPLSSQTSGGGFITTDFRGGGELFSQLVPSVSDRKIDIDPDTVDKGGTGEIGGAWRGMQKVAQHALNLNVPTVLRERRPLLECSSFKNGRHCENRNRFPSSARAPARSCALPPCHHEQTLAPSTLFQVCLEVTLTETLRLLALLPRLVRITRRPHLLRNLSTLL